MQINFTICPPVCSIHGEDFIFNNQAGIRTCSIDRAPSSLSAQIHLTIGCIFRVVCVIRDASQRDCDGRWNTRYANSTHCAKCRLLAPFLLPVDDDSSCFITQRRIISCSSNFHSSLVFLMNLHELPIEILRFPEA